MRMICDGTYDGLLTALFYAYKLKPDEILLRPAQQLDMLDAPMQIATDITKSARVQIAIDEKLSVNAGLNVRMVYASGRGDAGTLQVRNARLAAGAPAGRSHDRPGGRAGIAIKPPRAAGKA